MPELPEVETTIKGLNILIGLKIIKVNIHKFKLRYTIPKSIYKIQKNSIITDIRRVAKYILIKFDNKYSIVFHLGMSGRLKILNNLGKRQKHDHFITINHLKEKCTSNQLFKYILSDAALGIFNGKVIVKKDAQQTNANQTTRNLLLNDKAAAHSNPQLEIYADDVKCSHGSTTGQLDNNAIFYMRSRGIDFKSAQLLLINGFAKEILELISENKVNEYVNDQISYWLENININL